MAAAGSSRHLLLMLFCLHHALLSIHVPLASSLSFALDFSKYQDNPCQLDLRCELDAHFSRPMLDITRNDRLQNTTGSLGRASYARPVPLWDNATGELASFTTTFSFQITRAESNKFGDGMAFFLAHYPSKIPANSGGVDLGLLPAGVNGTGDGQIVAVEFDTWNDGPPIDNSSSHIGIDVNSVISVASTNTTSPTRNLTSGFTMTATINYDNGTKILTVDLQINDTSYHVNASVDLRTSLPEEVAVGFSGATGSGGAAEMHRLLSWSFNSTMEQKKPAPGTSAPTTQPLPTASSRLPTRVLVLVSVLVPLLFLLVSIVAAFLLWQPHQKRIPNETSGSDSEEQYDRAELERGVVSGPKRYPYHELASATSNFTMEEKLGQGGFGSVYRGHLTVGDDQDRDVAIKMFSTESSVQGRKEFEAEVRIISRLKHRNLVQLLGWCDSRKGLLLVYELVAEGSLDKHLHGTQRLLTWPQRYQIILGLGSALRYLHGEWEQCIVHGDIKPSNILLDSSYNIKLADFGLARLMDHGSRWQTTQAVLGTAGYIDPEFVNTCRASTVSDVYSFGIVLLEIVSRRRPVAEQPDEVFVLLKWVWSLYGRSKILDAVDERLRGDESHERQMARVLVVGLWCAHPDRSGRPSVAQAMHVLLSEDVRVRPPALSPHLYKTGSNLAVAGRAFSVLSDDNSIGVHSSSTTGSSAHPVE